MKHNVILTLTSLLTLLLLTFHLADDIVRGFEKGQASNLIAVPICVVWLYATLMLSERRSGYIIIILGSLLGRSSPTSTSRSRRELPAAGSRTPAAHSSSSGRSSRSA